VCPLSETLADPHIAINQMALEASGAEEMLHLAG
jgi:hypothetical protein